MFGSDKNFFLNVELLFSIFGSNININEMHVNYYNVIYFLKLKDKF